MKDLEWKEHPTVSCVMYGKMNGIQFFRIDHTAKDRYTIKPYLPGITRHQVTSSLDKAKEWCAGALTNWANYYLGLKDNESNV